MPPKASLSARFRIRGQSAPGRRHCAHSRNVAPRIRRASRCSPSLQREARRRSRSVALYCLPPRPARDERRATSRSRSG
ncbi:hypothetical protein ACFPRL_17585 [Pseudoclavibacter helvolus]